MSKLIDRLKKGVAFAEKDGKNTDGAGWVVGYDEAKEIIALKEWKNSAMKVFNDIDLQEVAKEMNLKPGEDIAKNILPFIKRLKSSQK